MSIESPGETAYLTHRAAAAERVVDEAVSEDRRAATLARVWERMAPPLAEDERPASGVQTQGYPEHVRRAYREGRW